jgi:hypothetical protein
MCVTLRQVPDGDVDGAVQGASHNNSNNNISSQAQRARVVDAVALQRGGQDKARKRSKEKLSNEIVVSLLAVAFVVGLALTMLAGPKYLRILVERVITLSIKTSHP